MEYRWDSTAISELTQHQRDVASDLPDVVDDVLYEWAQETRGYLKGRGYPPAPEGSRYQRTGLLANKWTARREGRGMVAILNEAASKGKRYPGYVIGDDADQAYMHEGRWWQAPEEIAERIDRLDSRLAERLDARYSG